MRILTKKTDGTEWKFPLVHKGGYSVLSSCNWSWSSRHCTQLRQTPVVLLVLSFCGIIYATAGFCAGAEDSNAFFRRMWRIRDEVPRIEIVTAG
jgi:hypothetical protein